MAGCRGRSPLPIQIVNLYYAKIRGFVMPTQVSGAHADIHTWENLTSAYLRAAHGKRSQEAAARFKRRLEDNLVARQDELVQRIYRLTYAAASS